MTHIELAPEVLADFDRILSHLKRHDSDNGPARIASIVNAVDVLAHSPRIGRPCGDGLRELVIGTGASGFVALYQHLDTLDVVLVLAVRSQREAGYSN